MSSISIPIVNLVDIENVFDKKMELITQKLDSFQIKILDPLLTTDQVTAYFQISSSTLGNWRKKGLLPFVKLDKGVKSCVRYRQSDIEKVLETFTIKAKRA